MITKIGNIYERVLNCSYCGKKFTAYSPSKQGVSTVKNCNDCSIEKRKILARKAYKKKRDEMYGA